MLTTLIPLIDDLDIPMIITTKKTDGGYSYEYINIDFNIANKDDESLIKMLKKTILLMDAHNNPLPIIEVNGSPIIEIHYGDSVIVNNLKWLTFIEFSFIII